MIDVDKPVWVLRSTEPPATTTSTQSTSYVAHSTVLPRTALSASQSKGTAPAAHTTPQIQSQYLYPLHTQIVAADIHPPPASFVDTSERTCTYYSSYCTFSSCRISATFTNTRGRDTTAKTNTYCRHYCTFTSGFTLSCTLSSTTCTCHSNCAASSTFSYVLIYICKYCSTPVL